MYNNEEWRIYEFGEKVTTDNKLAFSKFGEIKSITSKNPKGNIIYGSLREGYPIITISYNLPLSEKDSARLNDRDNKIKELRTEIKELKRVYPLKATTEEERVKIKQKINKLKSLLEKELNDASKDRKRIAKKRKKTQHVFVHRAVAELFIPNDDPVNKSYVIHKNFVKTDNRVENLAWASQEEVIKRSFESPNYISYKIKNPKRDPNLSAKLSYNDIIFIKRKLQKGEPMARLARRFGVSSMQIYRIKIGENWGDVKLSLTEK